MGSATVVGITRAPSVSEDGGVLKARCADEHQALQHAERKVRTYGKALFALAGLLCLSVCGNLASSAQTFLVFKESRTRGAVQPAVLSDSKPAAPPVATGLTPYGTGPTGMTVPAPEVPTYVKDTPYDPKPPVVTTAPAADTFPLGEVSTASVPGVKRCAIAPRGTEACWELADPAMTDIPDYFLEGTWYLEGKNDLTGTLKVGPAVKTIGAFAFAKTKLTGLDLSKATSLVWIGNRAFLGSTDLAGTLKVGPAVKTIGAFAFANTKLAGLDLSKATSLVEIGENAFSEAKLEGTLAVPDTVTRIGASAFAYTTFAGLDLSKATSLVEIGESAFSDTKLAGTLAVPNTVTTIGNNAFSNTKLTGLDLSKATSLVSIEERAFSDTYVEGTLAVPNTVKTIGSYAFYNTKLTYLDLSDANSLLSFGDSAFPRHVGYL